MAQMKDIIEIERNRLENGPLNVIQLFPEGTFISPNGVCSIMGCGINKNGDSLGFPLPIFEKILSLPVLTKQNISL